MAYATVEEFAARYRDKETIQLSNRGNAAATAIDEAVVQDHLEAASGIIDSYLSGRYQLPLSNQDQIEPLKTHCLRLARCEMDSIKSRDVVEGRCEQTIEWLKLVAMGKIQLGNPALPNQPDLAGSSSGPRARWKSGVARSTIDLGGF